MKKIKYLISLGILTSFISTGASAYAATNNTSYFVKGNLSQVLLPDSTGVHTFFNSNKIKFGITDATNELEQISSKSDNLDFKHIRLQQKEDGIPVYGHEYIVHFNKLGQVYAVNGNFDSEAKNIKVKKENLIGKSKALEIAENQVKFNKLEITPTPTLYLYKINNAYTPVYEVRINFIDPTPADWHFFIDAYTGQVVHKLNALREIAATGTGTGVLGDTKTLNLQKVTVSGKVQYQLKDLTRGSSITTYTSKYGTSEPGTLLTSTTNVIADKSAVDAHYYAGVVYDYYKNTFGRNGIDNKNLPIISSVHYQKNWVNAAWTGTQMVYGDGDGTEAIALSGSLDVIGHELTHGVDQYEANLNYENQPGALNESFSDVFGTFIEFYGQPSKADWLLGEDIWTPNIAGDALRSMKNPTLYDQPDNFSNYVNTTDDNGGVHTNSGIPNKAAYLTATNSNVGISKAQQIYYRALTNYLTSDSSFHDAKLALEQSAQDLYGTTVANAVVSAWNAVGVQ